MPDAGKYGDGTAVVAIGRAAHAKAAATFFDAVVPFCIDGVPETVVASGTPSSWRLSADQFKKVLLDHARTRGGTGVRLLDRDGNVKFLVSEKTADDTWFVRQLEDIYFHDADGIRQRLALVLRQAGFGPIPILVSSPSVEPDPGAPDDISLALTGLSLIDFERASWDQILDLRSDADALLKLKRLRLFFYTNYKDKEPAFVRDDLERRIHDYEETVREKGFETVESTFSAVFLSRDFLAVSGGIGAAALFGSALATATAGLLGGGIALTKGTLSYAKGRRSIQRFRREHDLAYLIDAKRRLAPP